MIIPYATNTTEVTDAIRETIGREVTFNYTSHYTNCPICSLNIVTNESTNPFCSGCGGSYFIPVISGYSVLAVITWNPSDIMAWSTAGKYYNGDCLIQVKYVSTLPTILDKTDWIDVDGKKMEIYKRTLRGAPEINRVILELTELEK